MIAESYADTGQALVYHLARENNAWADASPAEQAAALIRATDYIDGTYRAFTPPIDPTQALQWPTSPDLNVPACVVRATMLLALYALTGPLTGPASQAVKHSKKVGEGLGSIETTYEPAGDDPYPFVTDMIANVARLRSAGGLTSTRLTR